MDKKPFWVNVYEDGRMGCAWESRKEADRLTVDYCKRVACIKVTPK